jgi:hypothetical protein
MGVVEIGTCTTGCQATPASRAVTELAVDRRFGRVTTCEPRDQVPTKTRPQALRMASAMSPRTGDRPTRVTNSRLTSDRHTPTDAVHPQSCAGGLVLPRGERECPAEMTVHRQHEERDVGSSCLRDN